MAVHTDAQKQGDQAVLFRTETVAAGERRYYRDRSQILREVWMPGDGDGGSNYGRTRTDITNKWRFYQSPTDQQKPPPRNVILDDEAVYRIMEHHLATKKDRGEFWECDFTASKGTVLVDRPNRGYDYQPTQAIGALDSRRTAIAQTNAPDWRPERLHRLPFWWRDATRSTECYLSHA